MSESLELFSDPKNDEDDAAYLKDFLLQELNKCYTDMFKKEVDGLHKMQAEWAPMIS